MANQDTQNRQIVNYVVDVLKLNPITDAIPQAVVPTIQPTFEVGVKRNNIVRSASLVDGTSATIYTTPSDRDFFINFANASHTQSATSLNTETAINCTIDGTSRKIVAIAQQSGANQVNPVNVSYTGCDIKIDRNTAITLTHTDGTTLVRSSAVITGYTEEAGNNLSV